MRFASDPPSTVVFASWIVLAVTWAITALFTKRTLERRWGWARILLLLLAVGTWELVRHSRGAPLPGLWRQTRTIEWLAAAVVLAGLAVALAARAALGSNWSGSVTFKEGHELIVKGPYRYVRHPIYSGLLLMSLGTALLLARVPAFVVTVVLFVSFWFKLRAEEQLMTEHFPDAYPAYRRRVKALIPYVV